MKKEGERESYLERGKNGGWVRSDDPEGNDRVLRGGEKETEMTRLWCGGIWVGPD